MKYLKKIIVMSLFIILLSGMAACTGATLSDNNTDTAAPYAKTNTRYTPGDCFTLNNCRGSLRGQKILSPEECVRLNGNSWVDAQAECVSDIDQD